MKKLDTTNIKIKQALDFAAKAHAGVPRNGNDSRDYITHPLEVASLVQQYHPENINAIITALLHDTVEDCSGITIEVINEQFGVEIASLVNDVTDKLPSSEGLTKQEFKKLKRQMQVDRLKALSLDAKLVRLGDKISNTSEILDDKNREWQLGYIKFMRACYDELKDVDSPLVKILEKDICEVENALLID